MTISVLTGRHLSWLACSLLVLNGSATGVCVADDVSTSVNSELLNLARAFRSLDQSYQYRGMSSRLASTASSVFVDWEARGVPPEHRHPAVAPVEIGLQIGPTSGDRSARKSDPPYWAVESACLMGRFEVKDVNGGQIRSDTSRSSGRDEHSRDCTSVSSFALQSS